MFTERSIRREETLKAILLQEQRAKRYLRETQEEQGLPVYHTVDKRANKIKFTGIWYAGRRTPTRTNWHFIPFDAVSLEYRIDAPTMTIERPWNILCWTIKDGKPSVVIDPTYTET